jgi:hypothetical protein
MARGGSVRAARIAARMLRPLRRAVAAIEQKSAQGPNPTESHSSRGGNSILDNCHVRVCFATNDERTAKRVSDALRVATELRAQRNYSGPRCRRGSIT